MSKPYPKFIFCVTAVLLILQVFAFGSFAQETGIDPYNKYQSSTLSTENMGTSDYTTIRDENGEMTVKAKPEPENAGPYPAYKYQSAGDSRIDRMDLNNFVTLRVPDPGAYLQGLIYKNYTGETDYYYSNYTQYSVYYQRGEAQTTITLGQFDWSIADSYFMVIGSGKGIYTVNITQADLTGVKNLSMDSTYTTVSLDVPSEIAQNNYRMDFSLYDEQDKFVTSYFLRYSDIVGGLKIPCGHYKIQASGYDSYSFSFYKTDYNLTPSTSKITFTMNEIAKVTLNETAGNPNGKKTYLGTVCFMPDDFDVVRHFNPGGSSELPIVYVSKLDYSMVRIMKDTIPPDISHDPDWTYSIDQYGFDVTGSSVLEYDLDFRTQFIKPTGDLHGGDSIGGFNIINSHSQSVKIYEPFYYAGEPPARNKVIKLTKGTESYTLYSSDGNVVIPNPSSSGNFTVEFSAPCSLSVTPLTDSLYIYRSETKADDSQVKLDCPKPVVLDAGDSREIEVTVKNTGTNVWTADSGYKLNVANRSFLFTTSPSFPIPAGQSIKENEGYTFTMPIRAPNVRGVYYIDLQMANGDGGFGETVTLEIIVNGLYNPYPVNPVGITSVLPDKASPQMTGTTIRWTCSTTGGSNPVYYFEIYKGNTLVKSSSTYTSVNYFDWIPTEAGTDYRVMAYVKENGSDNSTAITKYSSYYTITLPSAIVIESIVPDKTSPQMIGTPIRWTCNITGGANPVYYFKVFKGSMLVKNSAAYTAANYFDWIPVETGTDYRVYVYVKENISASSTAVTRLSSYYTVTGSDPIVINSLMPDKASPQMKETTIRWTCNISGGANPVYYFEIFKGSTLVVSSTAYTDANYFDWTPLKAGTDYRAYVYVKENGAASSTAVTNYSGYFTVTEPAPIKITSLVSDKTSPQSVGTPIRWICNITGGAWPEFRFRVYKGSTMLTYSKTYTDANYFDWTPTEAGTDYRAYVSVRERGGTEIVTATKFSSYFTVTAPAAPITITSLESDKTSPQTAGTKIRWTCNVTGGSNPVYYFKVFNGSTLIQSSTAYTSTNYIDWTPTAVGSIYRVMVYVKENGAASTTAVTRISGYYTITGAAPIAIASLEPDKTSPQIAGTKIRWTCNTTGGSNPVYYFKVFNGSTLIKSSTAYTTANYFEWTPTEAGSNYRVYVYVKENGSASSTAVTKLSSYFTVSD